MAENDLEIKIGADNEDVKKSLGEIEAEAKDMEEGLKSIALVSGAAFTALVAGAGVAVHAFAEAEAVQKKLILSLQNNGVASDELLAKYEKLASTLQAKTGVDDDAIKSGIALLQNYVGQGEVSEGLTKSLLDLAEKTGSVESAAQILGQAINGNTNRLQKYGIYVEESADKSERLQNITKGVQGSIGGLSEEMNKGLGSFRGLQSAAGNFLEAIGQRLAPAVVLVTEALTTFFTKLNENKFLLDFVTNAGIAAAIVAGLVAAFSSAALIIPKLAAAISLATTAMNALGISTRALVGATGLGLLLVVATTLYQNWGSIFPTMQAVFETFVSNIQKLGGAAGKILSGLITFDLDKVKGGLNDVEKVINEGLDNISKSSKGKQVEGPGVTQNATQLRAAEDRAAREKQIEEDKAEFLQAKREEEELALGTHSERLIELKKQEVELLKLLQDETDATDRERLQLKLEENLAFQDQAVQQEKDFQQSVLDTNAEYQALDEQQKAEFDQKNKAALIAQTQNELSIKQKLAADSIKVQTDANNKYLETQAKYGTVVAELEKLTQDKRVEALSGGLNAFAGLQKSKNKELQALGKAAAITQIGIDTAKGALAAYTNFIIAIPFPPVAIPLGIAAAAAVIATGAQSISDVLSAQTGGFVPGANLGGDSMNAILQPGEFIVPNQSAERVIDAAADRKIQEDADLGGGGGRGGQVAVLIGFDGPEAEKTITARRVEARALGTLREA